MPTEWVTKAALRLGLAVAMTQMGCRCVRVKVRFRERVNAR